MKTTVTTHHTYTERELGTPALLLGVVCPSLGLPRWPRTGLKCNLKSHQHGQATANLTPSQAQAYRPQYWAPDEAGLRNCGREARIQTSRRYNNSTYANFLQNKRRLKSTFNNVINANYSPILQLKINSDF